MKLYDIYYHIINKLLYKSTLMSNKLFCKLCYDSGRIDFDTHRIRSQDGKLTCKYLASICCKNCGEYGHTIKYCRTKSSHNKTSDWVSVGNKKMSSAIKKTSINRESNSSAISTMLGGAFSALVVDDDSNTEINDNSIQMCQETNTIDHTQLIGNNGSTVTITWATNNKPIDIFAKFKNEERRSWADMVDDDDD